MLTRRAFLATSLLGVAGCSASSGQDEEMPQSPGKSPGIEKISYGEDVSQYGELSRPDGTSKGTVVIIHGGFWQAQYNLSLGQPLAADLVGRGYTVWNLEYRRVGAGGGWPNTLADVAAGIDHLATLDAGSKIVAIGHSAGGQLAVWAAGRPKLRPGDPGARPKVLLTGVVSQAGVLDLATAARDGVGSGAPQQLAGGQPDAVPDHYRVADPIMQVPVPAPVLCLHARADANVPYAQSTAYVAAATKAGGRAALTTTEGDHFTLIDPTTPAWAAARDALPALLAGRLPG